MSRQLLLVVSDRFQFSDGRLVLVPDFPTDRDLNRSALPAKGEIVHPSGQSVDCEVHIHLTHFNIPSSADIDRRWRYVVELRNVAKDEVPVGSGIYVIDKIWA